MNKGKFGAVGRWVLIVASLLILLPSIAFLPVQLLASWKGPTWLNPGYVWTVEVDAISNPDKVVCLEYTTTPPGTSSLEIRASALRSTLATTALLVPGSGPAPFPTTWPRARCWSGRQPPGRQGAATVAAI